MIEVSFKGEKYFVPFASPSISAVKSLFKMLRLFAVYELHGHTMYMAVTEFIYRHSTR